MCLHVVMSFGPHALLTLDRSDGVSGGFKPFFGRSAAEHLLGRADLGREETAPAGGDISAACRF